MANIQNISARHAELVSASTQTLKQVQGDDNFAQIWTTLTLCAFAALRETNP